MVNAEGIGNMVPFDAEALAEERRLERIRHKCVYTGTVELLDCAWSGNSGRTVRFRLIEDELTRPQIEARPFEKAYRRRNNRAGTIYESAVMRSESFKVYGGPLMLVNSGSTLASGFWVKFWLDDEADTHPFAGYQCRKGQTLGEVLTLVIRELDDDGEPIDEAKRQRLEGADKGSGQRLSTYAAMLCRSELFAKFLEEKQPVRGCKQPKEWWMEGDRMEVWMRYRLQVVSRRKLDYDPEAINRFHEIIRRPFKRWSEVR